MTSRVAPLRIHVAFSALLLASVSIAAMERMPRQAPPSRATGGEPVKEEEVVSVCGTCHGVPPADVLPRSAWRRSFEQMAIIRSGLPHSPAGGGAPVLPDDMQRVLRRYERTAPEHLQPPERWPEPDASRFRRHPMAPELPGTAPTIASVRLVDLNGDGAPEVVASDMREGIILSGDPRQPSSRLHVVASVPHPARITPADLDGDGRPGFLVGDLGRLLPGDQLLGAVIWMRPKAGGGYAQVALERWPRIADVRPGDFNGDGKLDLAVAAFGWRQVGRVSILENRSVDNQPSLREHVVDPRPGAVDVIPVDLNGDGRLDLVTLLSQQFETVVAYINKGTPAFTFEQVVLYKAPHANWGSSGMEIVDLDGDGDLDVLLTNGDSFDDDIVKPYHGIQWLENDGRLEFRAHHLAGMPGVHRAKAADLDGDGDLDIVAGALLAGGSDRDETRMPALGWLEQTGRRVFERRTLAMGSPRHATLDVGDLEGDGDLDIVVGNMTTDREVSAWVEVWENTCIDGSRGPRSSGIKVPPTQRNRQTRACP